ncbi:MAG: sensor domain-containing diguanylate cyclase [Lachnospiraceae bacterium]|nr:sensor domain-containing diguanylate cyclase [Lachnospiraceae bacterium]
MDNQNRSSVLQWLVPTGVMMVVVIAMLLSFSAKSNKEAEASVSKTLIASTEGYGERFLHELQKVGKVGETAGEILERMGMDDSARVTEVLGIAAKCANVEKVLYCSADGQAVDQTGASLDAGQESWFEEALEGEFPYVYAYEEQAVIVVKHVGRNAEHGYLMLYYPMERFNEMLLQSGYDSTSFLAVVDLEGNILGVSGASTNACLQGGNIFTAMEAENKENARTIRNRLNNSSRGSVDIQTGKQRLVLTSVPLGTNRWSLILGVSESYAERQANYIRKNTRDMVFALALVIAIFFCVVMVINIVGKIRSNNKKKELEDKADTDLLTGLNNKLATERKIKDYMAQNPNKQCMMFMIDIDNFKKINDTMGHAFGDEVLRSLGIQIGAIFRASDIIGRVGGDEFMVFLKDVSTDEAILKEARKMEVFFKNFQAGEYVKYKATASIGVAVFPQEGNDFETLYKAADQGVYKAKKRGKNQLAFYRDREPAGQEVSSDTAE